MESVVEIPEDMNVEIDGDYVNLKSDGDVVKNKFKHPLVYVEKDGNKLKIIGKKENKRVKSVIQTFETKVRNAIKGLNEGFEYRLKIFYRHFPMDVKVQGDKVVMKNFLGEKKPREAKILEGVNVKIDDDEIIVTGADKENVGQTAANIERNAQSPSNKDKRIFNDGIYITQNQESGNYG